MQKGKEPTYTLGAVIAASADTCLHYGQPGEKSVDRTDTYLILNVQSCGLQLEPCLDLMAPETVCLVMQTLYKSTLNEAFIIRQIADAVVVSKNLLPPVKL